MEQLSKALQQMQKPSQRSNTQYPSGSPKISECVCQGTGTFSVMVDDIHHPWFGKIFPCICKNGTISIYLQDKIGSKTGHTMLRDISINTEDTERMVAAASNFINQRIKILTVWGNNGTGKTTTLMAITNEMIARETQAVYLTAYDAIEFIKKGFGQDYSSAARLETLCTVDVLCLDEITQVRWTEYVQEQLETILDRRLRAGLPLALAMDQDPAAVLSPRFDSRLRSGTFLRIGDPDWRPLIGKAEMKRTERGSVMDRGE